MAFHFKETHIGNNENSSNWYLATNHHCFFFHLFFSQILDWFSVQLLRPLLVLFGQSNTELSSYHQAGQPSPSSHPPALYGQIIHGRCLSRNRGERCHQHNARDRNKTHIRRTDRNTRAQTDTHQALTPALFYLHSFMVTMYRRNIAW